MRSKIIQTKYSTKKLVIIQKMKYGFKKNGYSYMIIYKKTKSLVTIIFYKTYLGKDHTYLK